MYFCSFCLLYFATPLSPFWRGHACNSRCTVWRSFISCTFRKFQFPLLCGELVFFSSSSGSLFAARVCLALNAVKMKWTEIIAPAEVILPNDRFAWKLCAGCLAFFFFTSSCFGVRSTSPKLMTASPAPVREVAKVFARSYIVSFLCVCGWKTSWKGQKNGKTQTDTEWKKQKQQQKRLNCKWNKVSVYSPLLDFVPCVCVLLCYIYVGVKYALPDAIRFREATSHGRSEGIWSEQ